MAKVKEHNFHRDTCKDIQGDTKKESPRTKNKETHARLQ